MSTESYAVFLSYNSEDHEIVEKIAVYLDERAGLRPWFDRWSLIPGEPWIQKLYKGLQLSQTCAIFVGKSGEGPWQRPEVDTALQQQIQSPGFRVIPILLPDVPKKPELPPFLSGNTWVDLSKGLDDDAALWRLECGIRGISPGRSRPAASTGPQQKIDPASLRAAGMDFEVARTKEPAHIFISYRHQEPDSSIAHAFANTLTKAGHKAFIDTGIRWGADWVKGIREALESSDFLLLLLSPESGMSEMVIKEVAIAKELAQQKNGIPIILPVRLRFPFNEPLPYHLAISLYNIHQEICEGPEDTPRLMTRLLEIIEDRKGWPYVGPVTSQGHDSTQPARPRAHFDPRNVIIPGGSIETTSRFYIMRQADEEVFSALQRPRATITVRGPRQAGKTSLIMGAYVAVKQAETPLRAAFIDFQALPSKELKSLDLVWRAITTRIAEQLKFEKWNVVNWKDNSYDKNTSRFLDYFVFDNQDVPLLICLDEVDCVFNSPIKSEFFGSVRAFYNRGAWDASWKNVRWLLGSSSEPSFFIEDLTQSPFNIGLHVELNNFTASEIELFAGRHGLSLDAEIIREITEYVGGRPYLAHLIFYHLARNPSSRRQIFDTAIASRGIFRDHLHSYLVQFQRQKSLARAMKEIIKGNGCEDAKLAERLEAAGLVRRDEFLKVVPLCRLYKEFFSTELK